MWIMTERGWRPLHRACVNSNAVEGVFVDRDITEVRRTIEARTVRWVAAMQHKETRGTMFRGDAFIERLTDAFGNKL